MLTVVGVFVICSLLLPAAAEGELETDAADTCSCPSGWSCRFNSYYKHIPNEMSWSDAEFYCQKLYPGAHLASIHSEDENNFIKEVTSKNTSSTPVIWIGASDCYKDRSFVWTDGSEWNYQMWHQGEPNNNGGREPCVDFGFSSPSFWNDDRCEKKLPFVCKFTKPRPY